MTDQERIEAKLRLESQFQNGAGWFYWIAGLSLINTLIALFNGSWGFISGLGVTQIVDGIAYGLTDYFGEGVVYYALIIDLLIIAAFFVLGWLSHKRMRWAMILGIVLYSLDALTFLILTDYLSIAFHALAIYSIFRGIQAGDRLSKLENMDQLASIEEESLANNY